jgi:hypothetical protein
MISKVTLFILGLVIGATVCVAVMNAKHQRQMAGELGKLAAQFTNQIADLEASAASRQTQLDQLGTNNDRLTAQVQDFLKREATQNSVAPKKEAAPKPKGFAALFGDGTNNMSQAMSKMMQTAMEQQVEGKLAGMKTKLNLTPEQEAAIRNIMTNQMSRATTMAQKMFGGEGVQTNDLVQVSKNQLSDEAQIKALLTPEQVTAYDAFQKEEQTRNARLVANAELMQLQSTLQLDETQQDKVFAVLAEQAQTQLAGNMTNAGAALDFRGQFQHKADALSAVLTADQLTRYKKFQEQQISLIEAFMPKNLTNQ